MNQNLLDFIFALRAQTFKCLAIYGLKSVINQMWKAFLAEFHGSAMMAFIAIVSGANLTALVAGLWMCVLASGGAFFNPCITLAFMFKKLGSEKVPLNDVVKDLLCILFQLLGAFTGSFIAWQVCGYTIALEINPEKTQSQAFFMEVFATCQLILTLMIIVDLKDPLHVGIFSVVMTVYLIIALAGPISGGCLNPTLCTGINLANAAITGDSKPIKIIWLYILAPLIGAIIGVSGSKLLMHHEHHAIVEDHNH